MNPAEDMMRLEMTPGCGERLLRFVGDRLRLRLRVAGGAPPPGWRALLRTNLGRAAVIRQEILAAHFQPVPLAGASWRDIPMAADGDGWSVELPLVETGYFQAKAYAVDPRGRQHWPEGANVGLSVHPDDCRTGNIIYCAFARLYGETRRLPHAVNETVEGRLRELDQQGYTVIPPSGKLRDLTRLLPHIFETLGCRVLQLLPINPTPTTYARFGRFGSPYACQDLTAIDPALAEFDRRTTALEQFQELVQGVHRHGGKLFLDLVINHTGWGATLFENHPEWYKRRPDGEFESPGAWGNIWRDLVELDQSHTALWETLAGAFLTWCRRGVDGFRCDAGYKVPLPVWQHITARVRQEYPDTVFLLEGLGGSWEATELLLTEGGMQWAYSELFQNYNGREVAAYLDYALRQSERVGLYTHYSETHDNNRLAARGRAWSLLRNRLCALASVSGGFGFTGGVEWLAEEKINVHQCAGLNWGAADNLVAELAALNRLLREHPCFFDGARLERLSGPEDSIYALLRTSAEGLDQVLVLINTDAERPHSVHLPLPATLAGQPLVDLLGETPPMALPRGDGRWVFNLEPAASFCLAAAGRPMGLSGEDYRRRRAQAAWALQAVARHLPPEQIGPYDWRLLAQYVAAHPLEFLAALPRLAPGKEGSHLLARINQVKNPDRYAAVVLWQLADVRRVVMVPPGHWLVVRDDRPFRAQLAFEDGQLPVNLRSVEMDAGHLAAFAPRTAGGRATLRLERPAHEQAVVHGAIQFLPAAPAEGPSPMSRDLPARTPLEAPVVLLTNGRGAMARICVDLGAVKSKYDCLLGANLHPQVPVDRHVLVKRVRLWVNADGFIAPLNGANLVEFRPGPPACWRFVANAGDGRAVELELAVTMAPGQNATWLQLTRLACAPAFGRELPPECEVSLTVRFDLEDRNFHWETKHTPAAEHHFTTHHHPQDNPPGFAFTRTRRAGFGCWPIAVGTIRKANGPTLCPTGWNRAGVWRVLATPSVRAGLRFLATRGKSAAGLHGGTERLPPNWKFPRPPRSRRTAMDFERRLRLAAEAFLVRRGRGWTVIAGYPWFLDWGRDTLVCARGLLAAGRRREVLMLLREFADWEDGGTLPNAIFGLDATNRDTSDAPLWFALACEEAAAAVARRSSPRARRAFYGAAVGNGQRTLLAVLQSIAEHYLAGTPNGIVVDPTSALVWSPAHFTWMDTNHPAATPRQGYPIEVQALWIRLLEQLAGLGCQRQGESYAALALRAKYSLNEFYWLEDRGWWADGLLAGQGTPARLAVRDETLRPNALVPVSLGLVEATRARRYLEAVRQHLLVPGAVRTLAPLPATPPLPVVGKDGRLLNNPDFPYWGRYEGDEDTRRKPAYHNGTAWPWLLPMYCEALVRAYHGEAAAVAAARAYLGSLSELLDAGCVGQLPEIVDGDAPHGQRGCDAQAWSVTEALRVWRWLRRQKGWRQV